MVNTMNNTHREINTSFVKELLNKDRLALFSHVQSNKGSKACDHYKQNMLKYKEDFSSTLFDNDSDESHYNMLKKNYSEELKIPFPAPTKSKFTFIDLFAGIGGFRIALQELGGKSLFSSEWNISSKKTFLSNYGEIPFGDITNEQIKSFIPNQFDILCAGFPCQAFSIAGVRKGFEDSRGTLFFDVEQIIKKHRPKAFILENVKNLISHDKGRTFKIIKNILTEKLGYVLYHKVLNTMDYANIPQNRERVFLVGFDPKQVVDFSSFNFPEKQNLTKSISDILDHNHHDDIYYYSKSHPYYAELDREVIDRNTIYQWRRVYVRANKSHVCPTLTANMGTGGHNVPIIRDDFGIRKLTPRECFNFQGFPQKFILPKIANSKLYMQAGNSVTMPLIKKIGEEILRVL